MTTLPGPGARICTNFDPTPLRVERVVPHSQDSGWWCLLCWRADDPRHLQGQDIVNWYRLEGGRLLGARSRRGQARYHAIIGREANGVDDRMDGPDEVACEVFVIEPARQPMLFGEERG